MLLGLVLATVGTDRGARRGRCRGRAREVLPQVGALVEGPAAYPHLSGRANLALLRRDRAGRRPARRGAAGSTRRSSGSASAASTGGRCGRTRSACASGSASPRALLREPRLLVLDEPTNGLDPQGIREIRELLLELNAAGTTIFLSSHLLAEVEQLCTRVGVLDRGRLVLQDAARRAAAADRPGRRAHARRRPARGAARRAGRGVRRPAAARPRARPGRAQRPAGRRPGSGSPSSAPERRTLEEVVLEATTGERRPVRGDGRERGRP